MRVIEYDNNCATWQITEGENSMAKKVQTIRKILLQHSNIPAKRPLNLMLRKKRATVLCSFSHFVMSQRPMAASPRYHRKTKLNRESLYRMPSKKGNPEIKSIFTLLHSMGLRLTVEPSKRAEKSSKIKKAALVVLMGLQ